MSDRVRLLGRGWQERLIGTFEKPPVIPEVFLLMKNENRLSVSCCMQILTELCGNYRRSSAAHQSG